MLHTYRNILITGGSGTLGRAIMREARINNWNAQFTVFSRSELRQAEMKQEFPDVRYILGDIRDLDKITAAAAGHDCVIHAAAMKRIPECEENARECMDINVLGSSNVIRACMSERVSLCVGVSTDKACGAITTYGASKRMMEGLFQSAPSHTTRFTLVRYGNVLESNGSVLLAWKRQYEQTGQVKVTDLAMSRFWMSEREAVACIDHASNLIDGTIAIPKVRAMKLVEMARAVVPHASIIVTGLRSREKIAEELVHPFEHVEEVPFYFHALTHPQPSYRSYTSDNAPQMSKNDILEYVRGLE